jgi:hypothetical protein
VLDVRKARQRAPASQPGQPPDDDEAPVPSVLLLSRRADRELDLVGRSLRAAGVPVTRLDAENAVSAGLVIDLARRTVRAHGRLISPTVTWMRHFTARAMPSRPGSVHRIFTAQSWHALAGQLDALGGASINPREPGLLTQLEVARAQGIAVPRTVVSTEPAAAATLLGSAKVVIKALDQHFVEVRPGRLSGVFAEVTTIDAIAGSASGGYPPVVMQEFIEHESEIRAYYVSGLVSAFAVTKSDPAQLWTDPARVSVAEIEPPPRITEATRRLAATLSLDYGAFDFLIAGGVPVFLEVNVTGDWGWIEAKAGSAPVSAAVATMLKDRHDQVAAASGGPRRAPLDPVTFLSGRHQPTKS